jgi:4-amino-4-deoxy-L-arabinose transferase-like glycosyltransferase
MKARIRARTEPCATGLGGHAIDSETVMNSSATESLAPSEPVKFWSLDVALLAVALLFGIGLNWRGFLREPLHIDEHVSFWIADGGSPSTLLVRSFHYSATPPFSFLLQRMCLDLLGTHEWALRIPATTCYAGSIVAIWWFGRRWLTPLAGGFAAVLLAVHPVIELFATAGRPYSVGMLLGLIAMHCTVLVREYPVWRLARVLWVIVNLALVQTHYLFVALWPIELLWLAWPHAHQRIGRRQLIECVVALIVCGLTVTPGLLRIWEHRQMLNWTTRQPRAADIASLIVAVQEPFARSVLTWVGFAAPFVWLAISSGAPAVWMDTDRWHKARKRLAQVLLWFLLPVGGLWLIGRFWLTSLAAERYLVIYIPAAVLVLSALASSLSGKIAPALALTMLVVLQGTVPRLIRNQTRSSNVISLGWQRAAGTHGGADLILVGSGLTEMTLVPIYRDDPVFHDYVACRLGRMYVRDLRHERVCLPMIWTPDMPAFYRSAVNRTRIKLRTGGPVSVWVVCSTDTDLLRETARRAEILLLEMGGEPVRNESYDGVECVLYRVP